MVRIVCFIFLFIGCDKPVPEVLAEKSVVDKSTKPASRQTAVFEYGDVKADGFSFVVKADSSGLSVWLPKKFERPYLLLPQVRSASGAKYKGDGVVVWLKGREALLEVDGETYAKCVENVRKSIWEDAKLRGVRFRAVGNEPGWHLELMPGRHIHFVHDYGQKEVLTPMPQPVTFAKENKTVYRAQTEAHTLKVTILGEPCNDTMSGEAFASKVMVVLDGKMFRGCGRALH